MALQKRILAIQFDFGTTCDLVTYLLIAKILLLQYNQHFYLDVWVSIRDLHQKKFCLIPLPVLATTVMRRGLYFENLYSLD